MKSIILSKSLEIFSADDKCYLKYYNDYNHLMQIFLEGTKYTQHFCIMQDIKSYSINISWKVRLVPYKSDNFLTKSYQLKNKPL